MSAGSNATILLAFYVIEILLSTGCSMPILQVCTAYYDMPSRDSVRATIDRRIWRYRYCEHCVCREVFDAIENKLVCNNKQTLNYIHSLHLLVAILWHFCFHQVNKSLFPFSRGDHHFNHHRKAIRLAAFSFKFSTFSFMYLIGVAAFWFYIGQ